MVETKHNNPAPVADGYPAHAVAIVGFAGRFPGARDLEAFWRNVREGVETLESFSDAQLEAARVDPALRNNAAYVRRGTVLEGADLFDAAFFGLSPREAQVIDPQQRIFLECAWEALEHAGYGAPSERHSVGVYAGQGINTYLARYIAADPALMAAAGGYQLMLGNDKDFLCTRASYKLDLRGPSVTVQTACSTSLVAVVMACRALARHECDIALAGGVAVPLPQQGGYLYQEGMILSPDGHCRPFDVGAAGTRPSAGCGIVVLKRMADAIADRDTIHAVIRGAAINNDGAGKAGYTAPSVDGQAEVIATAQALAGAPPRSIGYVEAHGTGTPLGDPIEIAALTQVFRASTEDVGFCRLGSLKANLGHLDIAAGVAALIKTVLVLQHRELPPLVNFTRPNPQLGLEQGPFEISAQAAPWHADSPRRAGVSSFGIGGTNAHVVLEEAPAVSTLSAPQAAVPPAADQKAHLLLLSARTASALESMTAGLATYLQAHPEVRLEDVEWTLQAGRRAFAHRRALAVRDVAAALEALAHPQRPPAITAVHEGGNRAVAFLFSGQGSQYAGMGASLHQGEPVFRDALDHCADLLVPHLGLDLREVLLSRAPSALINETRFAQPALFVMEYALARLWQSWGVQPAAMLGHSIGEFVAAHLAGVMSLEDALAVVAARGRLMQALPAGSMAAVHLGATELQSRLLPGVEIAASNAPALCTVSGPADRVAALLQQLQGAGIESRALHTSHAFHSAMMEPALEPFTRLLEGVELAAPVVPYISNVTGTWITAQQATSPAYYAQHLRSAVRFEAGVRTLSADRALLLLETGPGNALTTLARLSVGKDGAQRVLQSTARPQEERSDLLIMREAAARLWTSGVQLDFAGLHAARAPRRIPLPTYPFERKRYWADPAPTTGAASAPAQSRSERLEDWTFSPAWVRDESAPDESTLSAGTWLILGDRGPLSHVLQQKVQAAGGHPVLLERSEDCTAVIGRLQKNPDHPIVGAIHLWGLPAGEAALTPEQVYAGLVAAAVALGASVSGAVRLVHASVGAETVLSESRRAPGAALAHGPVLVLPAEFPNLRMSAVDLDDSAGALEPDAAAAALLIEAGSAEVVAQTAWRGGRRWLKRYERTHLAPVSGARVPFKEEGVYLITGALGGIGLTLGRWLASHYRARLLLTSRSGRITTDVGAALQAIEADGGAAIVAAADAADAVAMSAAIETARTRWGRIDGVIHAAGVSGSGSLASLQTLDQARATFRPKAGGLDVLLELLGGTPLDFVALMSSINSVVGTAGTCDYAAANAVLDAFAASTGKPPQWRHVVSINWGPWRDVGMAANLAVPEARRAQWSAFLQTAIPPAVGAEAFARAVSSRRARVVIASHDVLEALRARATQEPAVGLPASEPQARPELPASYDAPASELEQRLALIWSELLGVEPVGRQDDFFQLGGHSLLATRVLARVQESFAVRLELRDVFDAPTVASMAERINRSGAVAVSAGEEREEIEF